MFSGACSYTPHSQPSAQGTAMAARASDRCCSLSGVREGIWQAVEHVLQCAWSALGT